MSILTRGVLAPACVFVLLLAASGAQASTVYNFQDIVNSGDPTFNQELGINNSGMIAGYFGSGGMNLTPPPFTLHPNQGYTVVSPYTQGSFTSENFPGSSQTQVTGLNNTGTTVGFYADSNGANTPNFLGFADQGGTFTSVTDPSTPAMSPTTNQLLGVNDNNIAVGFYVDGSGNAQAYSYNIATMAFTPVTLPGADNAVMTTAAGINNAGEIAGFFTSAGGSTEGFIDNSGTFTLFEVPGSNNTMFLGINNEGDAVGVYQDGNGFNNGFVYNIANQTYQTVNDPNAVLANGGTVINGLNDNGQLVGFYADANGNTIGLLATAVPEPSSLGFAALGVFGLGLIRRFRKPVS
jgi:hypothetical protein